MPCDNPGAAELDAARLRVHHEELERILEDVLDSGEVTSVHRRRYESSVRAYCQVTGRRSAWLERREVGR